MISRFRRYAFGVCAASTLAACSASQPQTPAVAPAHSIAHHIGPAWTYAVLHRFRHAIGGAHPSASLIDVNGTLYGTTLFGGTGSGTVFSLSPTSREKVLHKFAGGSDGAWPWSELIDVNGTLYGTTYLGGGTGCGGYGCGTVYSITTTGTEKVLYSFSGGSSDGANPEAGLIDMNGTLYGTTTADGGSGCYNNVGCGTVFSVSTSGTEKVLHGFTSGSDGSYPVGDLLDVNGTLYGTTAQGGSGCPQHSCGIVFSITTSGTEKVLYSFAPGTNSDGNSPNGGLIDVNGTLYGTTYEGGGTGCGGSGCGVVFSVTTSGSEQVLYRFAGGSDGGTPSSGLIDLNGTLYGTTGDGGGNQCYGNNCGIIFSMTTGGAETVLYRFTNLADGWQPRARLLNVNGTLYGTAYYGGTSGCRKYYYCGTIFTLSP